MQDMLIQQQSDGFYDLVIEDGLFASAEGFETAIPTSFFTDARASTVQVQEAKNRRGWVGNILTVDIDRELGGTLWYLEQARLVPDTLNFAKAYAEDSLQWMIEDDIARVITVTVEKTGDRTINILTDITQINNTVLRFVTLWRSTDLTRILL